jgi:hypothetical protein
MAMPPQQIIKFYETFTLCGSSNFGGMVSLVGGRQCDFCHQQNGHATIITPCGSNLRKWFEEQ